MCSLYELKLEILDIVIFIILNSRSVTRHFLGGVYDGRREMLSLCSN